MNSFLVGDRVLIDKNSLLSRSWERSDRYGVDQLTNAEDILDAATLSKYRGASRHFMSDIEPLVHRLSGGPFLHRSVVIVANPDGYILESIGDPVFLADADKIHLKKGAGWSERVRGTNAIGTAISEGQSLTVLGEEHYCSANRFLYCTAAPISDPQGHLVAVLDVSGYYKDYHPAIFGLVDTFARQIEDNMLTRRAESRVIVELTPQKAPNPRMLLAFDEDGEILGMNREARHWLSNCADGQVRGLPARLATMEKLLQRKSDTIGPVSVILGDGKGQDMEWSASIYLDKRASFMSFSESAQGRTQSNGSIKHTQRPIAGLAMQSPASECKSTAKYTFQHIFAHDPKFRSVLELAKRAAETDYNILITGESGTGKEMVSQAAHDASHRRAEPFVAINCGAIPKTLIESELFGYEAGSFTGAAKGPRSGKIELAHRGTLFLDEVAEMPSDMQVALLRVLQERTVTRIGGRQSIDVDVRIICATNKDLWEEVNHNRFRADLYFRLLGIHIMLPPLRDREDKLLLAESLLSQIAVEVGKDTLFLSGSAEKLLKEYPFPGNIRELAAVLRQAAFMSRSGMIEPEDFPAYMINHRGLQREARTSSQRVSLREREQEAIKAALRDTDGNMTKAAQVLGIGRNTLYRKLKQLM